MSVPLVLGTSPIGLHWPTLDPFLFCAHHLDRYPAGDERMGPAASLAGRRIGSDFELRDGWRMYHGDSVPGFPRHPHRGFETVTLARKGFIDHSDSLGATARFGHGDVQWMTAGRGVVHCEMFPLVKRDEPNPTELFQIWLNLPRERKMVEPYFTMLWAPTIPRHALSDEDGNAIEVVTVTGPLDERPMPRTPPDSWAASPENEVFIWTIKLSPGARWTIPAASEGLTRVIYPFRGRSLRVGDQDVAPPLAVQVRPELPVPLHNGDEETEILMLQGRPLRQPVVQHGPFVMNTEGEIRQAFVDYQRTGFGGWPWDRDDPVHPRERGRFAVHVDGRIEEPPSGA